MDIFLPIVLVVIFFILFSVCGWCCKKKREGTIYGYGTPAAAVTVTTQHVGTALPPLNPPYPVNPQHPTPQAVPPPVGFAHPMSTHGPPYPPAGAAPYPAPAPSQTPFSPIGVGPYPPSGGVQYPPGGAPYPAPSNTSFGPVDPPPYHEAVGQPPPQAVAREAYSKQAPYNPNY